MKTNKKGISLIVLAITIIVMIILATAIVLSLTSNNVVDSAKEATSANNLANAKQLVMVAEAEWEMEEEEGFDSFKEYAESKLVAAGFSIGKTEGAIEVTEAADVYMYPVIPKGFVASNISTEDQVSEGLVIYEGTESVKDDADAQTSRNQFVWVPVPDISTFTLVEWGKGAVTVENTTSYNVNDAGEAAEYIAMKDSVEKYGGFYIARYEAGLPEGKTTDTVTITDKPVSKKGATVWNNIPWGESMTDIGTKGAVYRARQMYKGSKSVVSTLCYGVQWDAALQFIATNEEHKYYPTNSTGKGNYKGNYTVGNLEIGSSDDYAVNNIYDMAGNVWEWTMEAYSTSDRVVRGGDDCTYGADCPASYRYNDYPDFADGNYGFRLTLYIK